MEEQRKNYLGLDWGASKIGVALAHAETKIAVAYGMWPLDENLWPILEKIVRLEEIGTIVLGDPHHPEASAKEELEVFRQKLEADLGVEVVMHNEMFTSKMAQANLADAEKQNISAYDDAEAARLILASWLDKKAR